MTGEDIIKLASEISDITRHLISMAHEYSESLGTAVSPSVTEALRATIEQNRGLQGLVTLIEERQEKYFPAQKEKIK